MSHIVSNCSPWQSFLFDWCFFASMLFCFLIRLLEVVIKVHWINWRPEVGWFSERKSVKNSLTDVCDYNVLLNLQSILSCLKTFFHCESLIPVILFPIVIRYLLMQMCRETNSIIVVTVSHCENDANIAVNNGHMSVIDFCRFSANSFEIKSSR